MNPIQPATFQDIPLDVAYYMAPHMAPLDFHALRHTCKEYSQFGKIAPQEAITVDQLRGLIQQTPYIVTVDFSKCADCITDDHLELLAPYAHQIKVLNLAHCTQVTYRGFKVFEHSPLVALNLSHLSFSQLFLNRRGLEMHFNLHVPSDPYLTLDIAKLERLDLSYCDLRVEWRHDGRVRQYFCYRHQFLFKNCHVKHLNVEGATHFDQSSILRCLYFFGESNKDFLDIFYRDSYDWARKAITIIDVVPVYINNALHNYLFNLTNRIRIMAKIVIIFLAGVNAAYLMPPCHLVVAAITTLAAAIFVVAAGISTPFSSKHSAHLLASAKLATHDAISHFALSILCIIRPFARLFTRSLLGVSTDPGSKNVQDIRGYLFHRNITKV